MTDQFLGDELTEAENTLETAKFHIIPCALERTVSYGTGTSNGPAAIIKASNQLERWDGHTEPCSEGIYTHAPVNCTGTLPDIMLRLQNMTAAIVNAGGIPITLGGEHSLTYGAFMGIQEALGAPIGIVQVDAHADFRVDYQGIKHSHASVMQLLAAEGISIASLGVRALCKTEDELRREKGVVFYDADELVRHNINSIDLPEAFPEHIYISFDLDGLDPSILPATGTPVPGGLGYYQALDLVRSTLVGRKCVGIDIVELAPIENLPASDFTAAQITYALMSMV